MADEQDPPAEGIASPPSGDGAPASNVAGADPSAELEQVKAQLEASNRVAAENFAAAREALKAANPGLPEAAFEGDTLPAITERVNLARDAATAAAEAVRSNGAAQVPAGGGTTRQPAGPPEGLRGVDRIKWAIQQQRERSS